jgi:DNA invertase Pin-like site-specific DNA recombinase
MSATHSNAGRPERAACLYRNSDDRQENSVARQKDGVIPYARRRGYEVVAEYTFDGVPGDEIKSHPDWQRLLRDAGKRWTVLVMDEPSRLSREDPDEFVAEVKVPLKRAGVRADSVTKGLSDWDTIAGDILALVHAHKAREEVRDLSRRVLGGIALRAREGRWFGGMAPFGLRVLRDVDPTTGKVLSRRMVFGPEEEVRAVRFIFDAVANRGWSLRCVCRELEDRAVKPPAGNGRGKNKARGGWNAAAVRKMLRNRKYVGDLPWNQKHAGKYSRLTGGVVVRHERANRRTTKNDPADVILFVDHPCIPALVDRDTFARAAAALARQKKCGSPAADNNRYLLTHLLTCADCGAYMRGNPHHGRKTYLCSLYKEYGTKACLRNCVGEAEVWSAVLGAMADEILSPARLDEVEAGVERQLEADRNSGEADRLRAQGARLEKDLASANRNLALVPPDMIGRVAAQVRQLEAERDRLQERLTDLEGGASQNKAALAEARKQLWRLRESLEGDDKEEQAAVVREVVSKIEVRLRRETTHGRRSATGKGRTSPRLAGLVLHLRPGLGMSCLETTAPWGTAPRRGRRR